MADIVIIQPPDSNAQEVNLPVLTGDPLVDTLNSLIAERLMLIRTGSSPNYSVDMHRVDWGTYMKELSQRIDMMYKELAQQRPWELISVGI